MVTLVTQQHLGEARFVVVTEETASCSLKRKPASLSDVRCANVTVLGALPLAVCQTLHPNAHTVPGLEMMLAVVSLFKRVDVLD